MREQRSENESSALEEVASLRADIRAAKWFIVRWYAFLSTIQVAATFAMIKLFVPN